MIFSPKKRRRQRLRSIPLRSEWRDFLRRGFPLFECLPLEDQRELEGHIQVFLAEKRFEGCDGLVVTDVMRVVIAAQACLLLLHRETDYYPGLKSILVYPSTYYSRVTEEDEEGAEGLAGESWARGPVILAWDAVRGGVGDGADGLNVVFHEFAHQLDEEDGLSNGVPVLNAGGPFGERLSRYRSWAGIFSKEFERLESACERGEESLLDEYGASDPAEFFAVATEYFFERPRQLRRKHPELYGELKRFYRQDPAEWRKPLAGDPPE